jgi:hypothetical protein
MTEFSQINRVPRRELKYPVQVERWLVDWGEKLKAPGKMILIGSGALLWHAAQRAIETPLPENSMDVDPITRDDEIAELCYEAHIGSPFERENGWHINLMPDEALEGMPSDWQKRGFKKKYGLLTVEVPAPEDLLVPKLKRGEARDLAHHQWALYNGLISK